MGKYAIEADHVSMRFNINKEGVDNAKEYFIRLVKHDLHYVEFWALKDVSFKLKKGDRMGVLGFNGAGKSTLLKTIAGVLKPTQGSVHTEGVIAPMLELGAGFDSNYSGRENVFLYAAASLFRKSMTRLWSFRSWAISSMRPSRVIRPVCARVSALPSRPR